MFLTVSTTQRPATDLGCLLYKHPDRVQTFRRLGLDALHGFVEHEPLWKVHQAVFAVLALESEPVDPRL